MMALIQVHFSIGSFVTATARCVRCSNLIMSWQKWIRQS